MQKRVLFSPENVSPMDYYKFCSANFAHITQVLGLIDAWPLK